VIHFRLWAIPVRVQLWFFVTAVVIGPRDVRGAALWLPVVFVGVLIHELGHALAVQRQGLVASIELHGFGGVTSWSGATPLPPGQRALISAAGPADGVTVGILPLIAAQPQSFDQPVVSELLRYAVWVNLGWGVLNLLPVLPLDGGMIVGSLAEGAWGTRGLYAVRLLSIVVCIGLCVVAAAAGWMWSAVLAAVLAISNLQAARSG
jgi:Zn-dependent protease